MEQLYGADPAASRSRPAASTRTNCGRWDQRRAQAGSACRKRRIHRAAAGPHGAAQGRRHRDPGAWPCCARSRASTPAAGGRRRRRHGDGREARTGAAARAVRRARRGAAGALHRPEAARRAARLLQRRRCVRHHAVVRAVRHHAGGGDGLRAAGGGRSEVGGIKSTVVDGAPASWCRRAIRGAGRAPGHAARNPLLAAAWATRACGGPTATTPGAASPSRWPRSMPRCWPKRSRAPPST
jgi:hypothetical protein